VDPIIKFIVREQPTGRASPGAKIRSNRAHLQGNLVRIVVESGIVDESSRRTIAGSNLPHHVFGFADGSVEIVVKSFIRKEATDSAFAFLHVADNTLY